jgi:hypothetical protein
MHKRRAVYIKEGSVSGASRLLQNVSSGGAGLDERHDWLSAAGGILLCPDR